MLNCRQYSTRVSGFRLMFARNSGAATHLKPAPVLPMNSMVPSARSAIGYWPMPAASEQPVVVRNTQPRDFAAITELCSRIYPDTPPWNSEQLSSHLSVFPEGQFVAVYGPQ